MDRLKQLWTCVETRLNFHPGLQKKITGFINAAKNENLIFIVKDSHVDRLLQIY